MARDENCVFCNFHKFFAMKPDVYKRQGFHIVSGADDRHTGDAAHEGKVLTALVGSCLLYTSGLRVVYKLIYTETEMLIVVVGARADDEVYQLAEKRAAKNNL